MNLLFWKHKKDAHVIKKECYSKLPSTVQNHYHPTDESPTHYYDDSTSLITGIMVGEMLSSDNPTPDSPAHDSFSGFGGGDFGGGGSSDSWSSSSSSDSSSSYDSGASYDSGVFEF